MTISGAAVRRLGRYHLSDPLGGGPTGEVFRAKVYGVAGFERQFAVKRFHSAFVKDPEIATKVAAAARLYGSLEHPRIARLHEYGVTGGETFTATELVNGLDMARLIAVSYDFDQPLAPGAVVAVVSQIARTVGYAHGRGVSHLGICPTNLICNLEGEVKVTDFGFLPPRLPDRPASDYSLQARIPYISPEQLASEPSSSATDVFQLGVVAYELFEGKRCFTGSSPFEIGQEILSGQPKDLDLPKPLLKVLRRCLARSPFERFPDAGALADALDAAARSTPLPGDQRDVSSAVRAAVKRLGEMNEQQISGALCFPLPAPPPSAGLTPVPVPVAMPGQSPVPAAPSPPPIPGSTPPPIPGSVPPPISGSAQPPAGGQTPLSQLLVEGASVKPTLTAQSMPNQEGPTIPRHTMGIDDARRAAAADDDVTQVRERDQGFMSAREVPIPGRDLPTPPPIPMASPQPAPTIPSPAPLIAGGETPSAVGSTEAAASATDDPSVPLISYDEPAPPEIEMVAGEPTNVVPPMPPPFPSAKPPDALHREEGEKKQPRRIAKALLAVLAFAVVGVGGYFAYDHSMRDKSSSASGKRPGVATKKTDAKPIATNPSNRHASTPKPMATDGGAKIAAHPSDAQVVAATQPDAQVVAAGPPDAVIPIDSGRLIIRSTPKRAQVYLGGTHKGRTPLELDGISDKHSLALIKAGYKLYTTEITGHGTVDVKLEEVTPPGGPAGIKVRCKQKNRYYVFVDGHDIGQFCPTERIGVQKGPHVVEIYDPVTEQRRVFRVTVKQTRNSLRVRVD